MDELPAYSLIFELYSSSYRSYSRRGPYGEDFRTALLNSNLVL